MAKKTNRISTKCRLEVNDNDEIVVVEVDKHGGAINRIKLSKFVESFIGLDSCNLTITYDCDI